MEKRDVVMFCDAKNKNGEFSNAFMADFVVFGHVYCCAEQYKMSQKALMFRDFRRMNDILNSKDPSVMKTIGHEIDGFDRERWERVKRKVVKSGMMAKFSQNEELKQKLLATGEKLIVEANPKDRIWGIGFCKSDPEVMAKMDEWGENLQGKILMEVREELKASA